MTDKELQEIKEVLEIVFDNLNTKGWESSYAYAGNAGTREPNMYFKQTVSEKERIFV